MSTTTATPDARRFRDTLGLFATGVAVIVAHADGEVLAMTANAVSSLSLDPMLVMFCPGKKSKLARHVQRLSGFTINILNFAESHAAPDLADVRDEPAHVYYDSLG